MKGISAVPGSATEVWASEQDPHASDRVAGLVLGVWVAVDDSGSAERLLRGEHVDRLGADY